MIGFAVFWALGVEKVHWYILMFLIVAPPKFLLTILPSETCVNRFHPLFPESYRVRCFITHFINHFKLINE